MKQRRTARTVYKLFVLFLLGWALGLFGDWLATAGTIVGSVAIAVSSIGADEIRHKWTIAAIGTALVTLCTAIDTLGQLHVVNLKSELEKEVQGYASEPNRKKDLIEYLDGRLTACLNQSKMEIDHCDDLENILEHVDSKNGTTTYYRAEILRYRHRIKDSDDQFYRYLEDDRRLRPQGQDDNGLAAVCDENGTGYCRQRTAWVCHTMANDLYRAGCEAASPSDRRNSFERAREKLKCVDSNYKGGFVQRLGTRRLNSADLEAALVTEEGDSSRACGPAPPLG